MLPLELLALILVSAATREKEKEEETEEEKEKERRHDLVYRRGDLLEVARTLFTHFGIYLGGGRVAHFIPDVMPVISKDQNKIRRMVTNTRLILGVLARCGSVRVDSVEDFAYGSDILVNPMDKVMMMCNCAALDGEEVALRAEKLQGEVEYSLLWYNCEHYVMYCRYGTSMSFQTFQFCKTVRKLVLSRQAAKVTAMLGTFLLLYLRSLTMLFAMVTVLLPFLVWMAS
ncbi:lecithin retinol acyltransferase-like [Pholidichthys leucotaenia]